MTIDNHVRQLARRLVLSAAVLLGAAPAALADPPGYYFQETDHPAAAAASNGVATDAQIVAVKREADQALATARQALHEVQRTEASLLKAERTRQ